MTRQIIAMIRDSGAAAGDLVYVRASRELPIPGARLVTNPNLSELKAEALGCDSPLVATGPATETDERYADVIIDANRDQPIVIKRISRAARRWRRRFTDGSPLPAPDPGIA